MSFARNLFGRGSSESSTTGTNRKQAQVLVDRGIAAESAADTVKALECFRGAVEADASFAPAHMNLGISLQAAGQPAAAIASHERALAIDPEYAAAHYNLARTQLLSSHFAEAETSFRAVLRIRPEFPDAWVGLAGALEGLGRNEEALAALDEALALRSDHVGALVNSFALLRKLGRVDTAIANSRRVLALEPDNHLAHGTLALSLHVQGRTAEAERSYRQALTFNPDYPEAKANLALVLQATGRNEEAIPLLLDLAADEPADAQLHRRAAEALHGVALTRAGDREREVLLRLCRDDNLLGFVVPSIVALIRNDAAFPILQNFVRQGEDPFADIAPAVATFLHDPLLLAALPRIILADVAVEEVFTYVRRCVLFRLDPDSSGDEFDGTVPAEFVCALARQCHFSGYAFFVDDDEKRQVERLHASIENTLRKTGDGAAVPESHWAVAALYESLHRLTGSERLLERPSAEWSAAFLPVVHEQVETFLRERAIAGQIRSITTIDDEVSRAVRAQYEDNPYPRWTTAQTPNLDTVEALSGRLWPGREVRFRPRPVPILVAGCGTGRQPITVARTFPDGEILAVDLSLTSLAYAIRMTERLGIPNITYCQADILRIGDLDRRFAIIECCGVLHHLDDPMAGWRELVGLLEDDGLMKIALYSEKARAAVRAAWDIAQARNFPGTPEGVRRCRRAIMDLPEEHPATGVMNNTDFFSLDGCRDFIMHVREHQFTLPQIEQCLDELGLQFLGFECSSETRKKFRQIYPDLRLDNDLEAWHRFEEANPDTFIGTYSFWCGRK